MFTRCSHCGSWLGITADQLRVGLGQVRCGSCGQIFNALVHLSEAPPAMPRLEPLATYPAPPVAPAHGAEARHDTAERVAEDAAGLDPAGDPHLDAGANATAPDEADPSEVQGMAETVVAAASALSEAVGDTSAARASGLRFELVDEVAAPAAGGEAVADSPPDRDGAAPARPAVVPSAAPGPDPEQAGIPSNEDTGAHAALLEAGAPGAAPVERGPHIASSGAQDGDGESPHGPSDPDVSAAGAQAGDDEARRDAAAPEARAPSADEPLAADADVGATSAAPGEQVPDPAASDVQSGEDEARQDAAVAEADAPPADKPLAVDAEAGATSVALGEHDPDPAAADAKAGEDEVRQDVAVAEVNAPPAEEPLVAHAEVGVTNAASGEHEPDPAASDLRARGDQATTDAVAAEADVAHVEKLLAADAQAGEMRAAPVEQASVPSISDPQASDDEAPQQPAASDADATHPDDALPTNLELRAQDDPAPRFDKPVLASEVTDADDASLLANVAELAADPEDAPRSRRALEDDPNAIPAVLQADYARLQARRPRPLARAAVVAAAAVALLALVLQYAWFSPADLISQYPQARPYITDFCARLGCAVALPEDRGRIDLVARDVRIHPRFEGALLVQAAFINHAAYAQSYPRVRFTLFNDNGNVIASRAFTPEEYLRRNDAGLLRMQPGETTQIQLDLIAPEDTAVSFEFEFI